MTGTITQRRPGTSPWRPGRHHASTRAAAWLWLWRLCVAWCLLAQGVAAQAAQHIEQASRAEQAWPGLTARVSHSEPASVLPLPALDAMQMPAASGDWVSVALPDALQPDLWVDGRAPRAISGLWYRVAIDCANWREDRQRLPQEPVMLYLPRAGANGLHVYWQGAPDTPPVLMHDQRGQGAVGWNAPIWWDWPRELVLRTDAACAVAQPEGHPSLLLAMPRAQGMPAALSSAWVGPISDLQERWAWRQGLQRTWPQVLSISILALSLFALMVWRSQPHDDSYLLFALCAVVWALRNLHLWWSVPLDPIWASWFWWLAKASIPWFVALTFCFAYRFMPWRYRRVERGLLALAGLMNLLAMPGVPWPLDTALIEYALMIGVTLVATVAMTRDAFKPQATREFRANTLLFWLGPILGTHDVMVLLMRPPIESIYLVPLVSLGFMVAYLYALHRRYLGALSGLSRLNRELEQRVTTQRLDLERSHERLREAEQAEARMHERQRLMRDMHDGVGSSLITALAMVERQPLSSREVAHVLRECLDDLRMVIESMEPTSQDIGLLLGSLRARLGKRLVAAGLQVDWEIQPLSPLAWLQPTEALQLLRLVQEAISNVIKHAKAQRLTVRIHQADARIHLQIEDDGCGFDMTRETSGHGLLNMRSRALRLGGEWVVDSQPGQGTRLHLTLPVVRPQAQLAYPLRRVS